jgi:hypothetical protein
MLKYLSAIIVLVTLTACEQPADGNDNSRIISNNDNTYAMRATKYTWPPLVQGAAISYDVLAKNYYLVIDGSGSMDEVNCSAGLRKMDVAKTAVQQFVNQIPVESNVGLLTFDVDGVVQRVSLGSNRTQILRDVTDMKAGGGTPLRTAIKDAYKSLTLQAQSQLGYGEYHLVIVTDGEASSGEDPSSVVKEILADSPVILHTIGFCIGEGHSLNVTGKTDYRAANNPEELRQGLAEVLAEANEYTMDKFNQETVKP